MAKVPGKQNIHARWTRSTDGGTPTTGVLGYNVERSAAAGGPWSQIRSATVFGQVLLDDTNVGWSKTWYYRVQAVDFAGNASAYTAVLSATTDPQPTHDLTVTNNTGAAIDVWVQSATTGRYWLQNGTSQVDAAGRRQAQQERHNQTKTWSNLPEDTYNVFTSTLTKATHWSSDPWTGDLPMMQRLVFAARRATSAASRSWSCSSASSSAPSSRSWCSPHGSR